MEMIKDIAAEMRSFGETPPPRGAWLELADRIEVASKERESELLRKFVCVFAKTFLWELQRKENKEESMSEKNGVRPDGYKATDEEVAQQEEMIERKGLSCDGKY